MGIYTRFLSYLYKRASVNDDNMFINVANRAAMSKAGVSVTPDSALAASTVFACADILSGTLASLPLMLYKRRTDEGKEPAYLHSIYDLIHTQPNKYQTSFEFRRMMMANTLLRGFSCAYLEYNGLDEVVAIYPLASSQIQIDKDKEGNLWYIYTVPNNDLAKGKQEQIRIPSQWIWRVNDFWTDGLAPKSRITIAKESIGLAIGAEQFGAQYFGNASVPDSVLETPGKLSVNAKANLRDSLNEYRATKRRMTMVLEEGLQWKPITLSNSDSQYLETRTFQVKEIARWFNVPLVMLGEADKSATFASAEQFFLSFAVHTMLPWCVNWEQSISKDLLSLKERKKYFAEFKMDGLMRGDLGSRYNAYKIGREWGWLSSNDIRKLENMNPMGTEGDEYLRPMNMTLAGTPVVDPTKVQEPEPKKEGEDNEQQD